MVALLYIQYLQRPALNEREQALLIMTGIFVYGTLVFEKKNEKQRKNK